MHDGLESTLHSATIAFAYVFCIVWILLYEIPYNFVWSTRLFSSSFVY